MSPTTQTCLGTEVTRVLDLVRDRRDEIDESGRISEDVVIAIRETGLNRAFVPRALGGDALCPAELTAAIELLATADASTAWAAYIGAGATLFAGYMPRSAAEVVFADVDSPSAAVFAPAGQAVRTGDRLRLTGRWPFASNCLHARWIGLGCMVIDESGRPAEMAPNGSPLPRLVFAPASSVTIEPTWDTTGLRGTGSHHAAAADVDLDATWSCTFADRSWDDSALFRLPIFTALTPGLAAVFLGTARGVLDDMFAAVGAGATRTMGAIADDDVALTELATADASVRGARAGLAEAQEQAWALATAGEPITTRVRAEVFIACLHAAEVSVDAVSTAHRTSGGGAVYRSDRVGRALRDVQTARNHTFFSHRHRAMIGRALAGLEVSSPPLL